MKIQQKIMLPVISVMAIVVISLSLIDYYSARKNIYNILNSEIRSNLDSFYNQIQQSDTIMKTVMADRSQNLLSLDKSVALMISANAATLQTSTLKDIAAALGASEINVTDRNGVVRWGTNPESFGLNFNASDQTKAFLPILSDPNITVAQEPSPRAADNKLFQYFGVSRIGTPGIIQLGFSASTVSQFSSSLSVSNNISTAKIGDSGYLFLVQNGVITAHPDSSKVNKTVNGLVWYNTLSNSDGNQWIDIDGMQYYAAKKKYNDTMIVAVLPKSEFGILTRMVLSSAIFAVLGVLSMFVAVWLTVRQLVKPLLRLNRCMLKLSHGDFNVKLSSGGKDEISGVYTSVDKVVRTLRSFMDDIRQLSIDYSRNGNIAAQIDTDKYEGDFNRVILSINEAFDGNTQDLQKVISDLDLIVHGDLSFQTLNLPGGKSALTNSIDEIRAHIQQIIRDLSGLAISVASGDLSQRLDDTRYGGVWASLYTSMNSIIKNVAEPLYDVGYVMQEIAKGDFSHTIARNYDGDFMRLRDAINTTVSTVSKNVSEITDVLMQISNDNLNVAITREYLGDFGRIKAAINVILEKLNSFISQIHSASTLVSEQADNIAKSSTQLSGVTEEQTTLISKLSDNSETVESKTQENVGSARSAEHMAQMAAETAVTGTQEMGALIEAMANIKESSSNISQIISTIESIAFQTNILALNAAVESARAGVHGKGFGVVADQVRVLAQRSSEAAKETTSLIEDSLAKIDDGQRIAEGASETFNNIAGSIQNVSETMSNIADSSERQFEGIRSINDNVGRINAGTQSVAQQSEETANVARELSANSVMMDQLIAMFTLRGEQRGKARA